MAAVKVNIQGLDALKRAFRELEPKLARRVIKQAQKKALQLIAAAVRAALPVKSGALKKSVRIRASKGPRGSGRKTIAQAILVGASGKKGDKEKGIKRPWWAYLIEYGWETGKRIRSAGKVVGRVGKSRKIAGRHIVRREMRSHESGAVQSVIDGILQGIEREAGH